MGVILSILRQRQMFIRDSILTAVNTFLENPMETPFIPSWNRVVSAIPDILSQLKTAVELDNQEFSQVLKESNTYASAG